MAGHHAPRRAAGRSRHGHHDCGFVCTTTGPALLDTFLIGGSRISGAAETALLAGIAAGRRSATCPQPNTMFAVLLPPQTGSLPAYVEIGGCQRVLRPDNRIGQASPAALMIINRARHS